MTKEKWRELHFFSSYYGGHPECGEGDINKIFLFHPTIEIDQWSNVHFKHGHFGQNETNTAFEEWRAALPDSHFIEIEVSPEED